MLWSQIDAVDASFSEQQLYIHQTGITIHLNNIDTATVKLPINS